MTGYIFGTGGGSGTDVSDTTLLQNEAITGKYFYLADGTKVQGTIPIKEGITAQPTTSEQILVPAGTYAKGDQKIAAIKAYEQIVSPSASTQTITPGNGSYFSKVTVKGVELIGTGRYLQYDRDEYSTYEMVIPLNDIVTPLRGFIMCADVYIDNLSTSRDYVCAIILEDIQKGDTGTYLFEYSSSYGWEIYGKYNGKSSVTRSNSDLIVSTDARFLNTSDSSYRYEIFGL